MTASGLTPKQLLVVILSIIIVGLGSGAAVFELSNQVAQRSDNNGCVIKSVLNLGAERSYTSLWKFNKGISKQQVEQTRQAIPYEINLATQLLPDDKSCTKVIGKRYFAPRLKIIHTGSGIQIVSVSDPRFKKSKK